MYAVLATSPASEYVVLAVFATGVDHVILLSADLSILYPVIAEPPLFAGAIHDRLICDDVAAVAVSPVGAPGAVVDDVVLTVNCDEAGWDDASFAVTA